MKSHTTHLRFAAATGLLAAALWSPRSARAADCDSNLMIVLDRSCSMDKVPDGATETKWQSAVNAIRNLTINYEGQLRLGLIMFPDETGDRCAQDGNIYVNAGPNHEDEVMSAIEATTPTGPCVTNIDTALSQVWDDPAFDPNPIEPPTRRSFVVLVTDGAQSSACGGVARDPVTEQIILDLYAANFPTYVVGFGGKVRPDSLALFAVSGGVPRVGDPVYYQADTAADLDEVLDVIAGSVIGGDPEFGGCQGLPCPDERCPGEHDECVDSVCLTFLPDGGVTDAAVSGDDGGPRDNDAGIGGGATNGISGCGCRAGGERGGTFGNLLLLALALAFARRRRKAR